MRIAQAVKRDEADIRRSVEFDKITHDLALDPLNAGKGRVIAQVKEEIRYVDKYHRRSLELERRITERLGIRVVCAKPHFLHLVSTVDGLLRCRK
jgi:hypothetical protein